MNYIPADKLIAEIERLAKSYQDPIFITVRGNTANNFRDNLLSFITSLQQERPEVDLENYISNKLRELGADLINHKPYSFNRGLNVGKTNAYNDILNRLNARKDE